MFRPKSKVPPKPLAREPSRGPAAYDSHPAPSPVRTVNRATSNASNVGAVEPNTLVVAVDFGTSSSNFLAFMMISSLLTRSTGTTFTGNFLSLLDF
jgi:hypothetical protein